MKRDRSDSTGVEPHVFDQTNGVVALGENGPDPDDVTSGRPDDRTVVGIAMLSTKRP